MTLKETALIIAYSYLLSTENKSSLSVAKKELLDICRCPEEVLEEVLDVSTVKEKSAVKEKSYEETQNILSAINEKESKRKEKGVYYTPCDVVSFIIKNCIKMTYGQLSPETISNISLEDIPAEDFCFNKVVFDPTCGAGEFLLAALSIKFDLWDNNTGTVTRTDIMRIVETIRGNDINDESIVITKLRIILMVIHRYGIESAIGLSRVLSNCFTKNDYVTNPPSSRKEYDIVVGNPPYVEDRVSGIQSPQRYGNIYANVLVNAARNIKEKGVFGFIIPISYVSTPRMKSLRDDLLELVPEQYILSYSDRPDCLFTGVHQKLSIALCKKTKENPRIFTGNYRYWYKDERKDLFSSTETVENKYRSDGFIPKLGNKLDIKIYEKITNREKKVSLYDLANGGDWNAYVNMRAAFWIKAFREAHNGSEYKCFSFSQEGEADYFFCLMNSSLFWWFWIAVSDCWHITRKELKSFIIPQITDYTIVSDLADALEKKLEETKLYVGTVQTNYEYKHRNCIPEIHAIDDYINAMYGLTIEESEYIKQFAFNYRISGGTVK